MITLDKTEATLSGWPPLIIIRYYALEQKMFPIHELKFVALRCENIIKKDSKRILEKARRLRESTA